MTYRGFEIELNDDGFWHVAFNGSNTGRFALRADAEKFCRDTSRREVKMALALRSIAGWRNVNISSEYEHGLRDIIRSITDVAHEALEEDAGKPCHCGKGGHALNSVNCPVHGYETVPRDGRTGMTNV